MSYVKYGRLIEENTWDPKGAYKKAIMYDTNDIGKLRICSNESILHFMAKSILVYQLLRLKHRVVCEAEIAGGIGAIDVFDIDTNVMYELETEKSIANSRKAKEKYKQAGVDLVIIQIRNWTDSMSWLTDYIRHWIRLE